MLDKPTKDMEPARGWRFPRFLRFGDNGDETARPKTTKPPKEPEERKHHFAVWYVFAAFLGVMLIQYVWLVYTQVETIPYSQFEQLLNENKISEVLVGHDSIQGTLKQPLPDGRKLFYTVRVDPALADMLKAHGVTITGAPSSNFLSTILSWALPIFLFYLIWTYGIRRMAERQGLGGLMTIGKSRAKIYVETDTKVTFKDVAGVDEAKYELQEVVAFLRDPKSFGRLGARIPKGVLLIGPPGTGKTLLARAVAGEAGVPFFSISGSEFVEMFVGVGAARVRDLFEQARKAAPCIIFIDELDALGRSRVSGAYGGYDEKEQTLNQLLAELDGFDPTSGVILIGATNRPEVLDPALLRPGRFDRQVLVDRPDRSGRLQILKVHVAKIRLADGVDLDQIAGLTTGFTGADLANLVNEAAIVATRRKADAVTLDDFTAAIERIVAGLEKKSRVLEPRGTQPRRPSRDGPCAGRRDPAGRRSGPQGVDHPARRRRARLYDAAADRGSLSAGAAGAGKPHRRADGRTGRGSARLRRRGVDRGFRRPAARDPDRNGNGHALRHERDGRTTHLRAAAASRSWPRPPPLTTSTPRMRRSARSTSRCATWWRRLSAGRPKSCARAAPISTKAPASCSRRRP